MAVVEWQKHWEWETETIDAQHKHLVDLVNRMHDEMRAGRARSVVGSIILDLIAYASEHFETEENIMAIHEYYELNEHRTEHKNITAKLLELQIKLESDPFAVSIELINFLTTWLVEHLSGFDKRAGETIRLKKCKKNIA